MSNTSRRPVLKYLIGIIAIVAIVFLLYKFRNSITLQGFRWDSIASSLRHTHASLLLLSLVTIYVCYAIRALRWNRFSRHMGPSTFSGVYRATLMGFTAVFLLGRVGEPIRPILIARKEKLPFAGMFGVYVLERIMDTTAAGVFAGVALVTFSHWKGMAQSGSPLIIAAHTTGVVLLAGLSAVWLLLIYFRIHGADAITRRLSRTPHRAGWRAKVAMLILGFSDGLRGIQTVGEFAVVVGYTAMHWILVALIYLWVPRSFGGEFGNFTFQQAALVFAFTVVGSAVQLPGVGGGAQVATFLVFTVIYGVEKGPAAAASILIWLITFAGVSLAGLPLLFHEGWSMSQLRNLARAEEKAEEAGTHIPAANGAETPGALRR